MATDTKTFPLTYIRLRFHCQAETRVHLGGYHAGSNLRGTLVNVMRRAVCTGDQADAAHVATCPVCWLVAANERPGQERRGYVIAPPALVQDSLAPGEAFDFHITLFGDAMRYLPYFVLAVPEAGRMGVGPGRGRFGLRGIAAEHLLEGDWIVLREGETLVRPPAQGVNHADVLRAAAQITPGPGREPVLRFDFLTPLRLTLPDRHLLKAADFGVFFNHLLLRVDMLAAQHAGGRERPPEERQRLWDLANRVRLVESGVHWEDVLSGSSRTGNPTWISGLVGPAWYSAPCEVWQALLPWLLWGQVVQVGKDTVKGNGVYHMTFE